MFVKELFYKMDNCEIGDDHVMENDYGRSGCDNFFTRDGARVRTIFISRFSGDILITNSTTSTTIMRSLVNIFVSK